MMKIVVASSLCILGAFLLFESIFLAANVSVYLFSIFLFFFSFSNSHNTLELLLIFFHMYFSFEIVRRIFHIPFAEN